MHLEDVVTPNIIDLRMTAKNKQAALEHLTMMLLKNGRIKDSKEFMRYVLEREETETTDLDFGVAIPHGMCDTVLKPSVAIGKLVHPFYWNEEQGEEPVFAIFLMATSPDERGRSHIEVIAEVASLLIEEKFVAYLRENDDKVDLLRKIKLYSGEK